MSRSLNQTIIEKSRIKFEVEDDKTKLKETVTDQKKVSG
jgi:hypothetical protein